MITKYMSPMMNKEAIFTMKWESELRADFIAEAEALHRPASQVLRDPMREFVQRQREIRNYDEFLNHKAEAARQPMRVGIGHSHFATIGWKSLDPLRTF